MSTQLPKKDQPSKPREGSRIKKFVGGIFVGFLAGWIGGQFTYFESGFDLAIHLGVLGLLFGIGAVIFPEEKFSRFINWLH
jgi:uncharacterized membrane protein YeaQ/YmgE (transglycosylase-associated protein family)